MNYEKMTKAELIREIKSLKANIEIAKHKQIEEELSRSEQNYRNIFENAMDGIVTCSLEGDFVTFNNAFAKITGYSEKELFNMKYQDLTPVEYNETEQEKVSRLLETGESQEYEKEYIRKDGTRIPLLLKVSFISDSEGKPKLIMAIVKDMTKIKRAEVEIKNLARFPSENPNPVLRIARNGKVLYANNAGPILLNFWDTQIGKAIPEFWHKLVLNVYRSNSIKDTEIKYANRVFFLRFTPVAEAEYVNVYGLDITERKNAEKALKESEKRFRVIFEQAAVGVAQILTETGQFVMINKRYCDIVGYTQEEMVSTTFMKITHPDDLQVDLDNTQKMKEGKIREFSMEKRYYRKDGSIVWVNLTVSPMWNVGEQPNYHIAVVEDITARKNMEEKLRRSEKNISFAQQLAHMGSWEWDIIDNVAICSDEFYHILGLERQQFVFTYEKFMDFIHPEDREFLEGQVKKTLHDGKSYSIEYRVIRLDGSERVVHVDVEVLLDENGNAKKKFGTMQDITERKQAEEDLHVKNSYLKLLQVAAVAANEAVEIKDAFQPVLEEICNYTGWEIGHAYAISKNDPDLLEPTSVCWLKDSKRFKEFCDVSKEVKFAKGIDLPGRVLASRKPHWIVDVTKDINFLRTKIAKTLKIKSGIAFPVMVGLRVVAVLEFFTTKEVEPDQQFMRIMADIGTQLGRTAERKRAEEELIRSKETLDHAQKIAHLGSWESDIVKNRTIWSDEVYRQFDLIPQEFDGKNDSFLNFVHPDDKEAIKKAIKEALYKRMPYNVDFRIISKDGTERILHSNAEVVFDDNGKPLKMIGTSLDITESKQVDKAIQALVKSTVGITGQEFFDRIVVSMNEWLGTHCAFIGQITNGNNVKALSMQMDGNTIHDYGYTIGDGPCEVVVKDGYHIYKEKICELFPKNKVLSEIGAEGYVGAVLRDKNSKTIGIIWAVSRHKLNLPLRVKEVMEIIAAKAGSEIERKQIEEELRNSDEALHIASEEWERSFNVLPDHICILDMSGAIMRANKTMRERFEPIHGDLKGLDYRLIYCGTTTPDPQPPCAAVLSGSPSVLVETQLPTMDGWQRVSSFPLFSKEKKQIGAVSVVTDITERKRIEDVLLQSEKMKAMGIMTSGVAHEFNNILAVISCNVQLLEEANRDDKELTKVLRTICRVADDGAKIVDRMYDFTGIRKDASKYICVNISNLIKQVIDFTTPRWKEMAHAKGITYHIDKKCTKTLPSVLGNPSEIREALLNIVNNALDAMPDGGTLTIKTQSVRPPADRAGGGESGVLSPKFGVRSKEKVSELKTNYSELKGDYVRISFEDTGYGMLEEVTQKIFDPFFTTRSPEGTGLGMSITYGIIARHGGKINVESELGNGSKITINLPIFAKTKKANNNKQTIRSQKSAIRNHKS